MIGYIFAFISSLFFILYVVPRKFSKQSPIIFSFFMAVAFFIGSLFLYLLKPILHFQETPNKALLLLIVAGVIWAAGFVAFLKSIDLSGLTRSNQWKNLQGPIGVLLSLLILSEYTVVNSFYVILAGFTVFFSALFFAISESKTERKSNLKGIYFAVLSAFAFGIVTVINKFVTVNVGVYSQQVVWSLSIALSLLAYIIFQRKLADLRKAAMKDFSLGFIAGMLYLGASFFMLQSYKLLPASIAFTIIQLNAVWTIGIGLFVFKEIDFKKHSFRIILGLIFAIIGIAILAFANK